MKEVFKNLFRRGFHGFLLLSIRAIRVIRA